MKRAIASSKHFHVRVDHAKKKYKDCLNEIRNITENNNSLSAETIHDLRANLKKADALIKLLVLNDVKVDKRNLKPFKMLFKTAGKVRTAQIESEILSKYFSHEAVNSNYLRRLRKVKKQRTQKYIECLAKISNRLKASIVAVKNALKKLTKNKIKKYLKSEEKILLRYIDKNIFREQRLHIVRKKLKEFYLNVKTASPDCVNRQMENMISVLGEWHDYHTAFDHTIKAIHSSQLNNKELISLKKVKDGLIAKKEEAYEKTASVYTKSKLKVCSPA